MCFLRFLFFLRFVRLLGTGRILCVAHIVHRATRTTAGAGGFSFFLISDHFDDDQGAYGEDDERDENGGEIC